MVVRMLLTALAAVVAVCLAVALRATANTWLLDAAVDAAWVVSDGTRELRQTQPAFRVSIDGSFSPYYLAHLRESWPSLDQPDRLGLFLLSRWKWVLVASLVVLLLAGAGVWFAGPFIVMHGWRTHLPRGDGLLGPARRAIARACLHAMALAVFTLPLAGLLVWYALVSRDPALRPGLSHVPDRADVLTTALLLVAASSACGYALVRRTLLDIAAREHRCVRCGYSNLPGAVRCSECGHEQVSQRPDGSRPRRRRLVLAVLLGTAAVGATILGSLAPESRVGAWLRISTPPTSRTLENLVECSEGDTIYLRWADQRAYITTVRWLRDEPGATAPPRGRTRVVAGYWREDCWQPPNPATRQIVIVDQPDPPDVTFRVAFELRLGDHTVRVESSTAEFPIVALRTTSLVGFRRHAGIALPSAFGQEIALLARRAPETTRQGGWRRPYH